MNQDLTFLKEAVYQARLSAEQGGFPAGSVLVKDGEVLARGVSLGFQLHDPTSHAETASIREACRLLQTTNLSGATLYSSMEPCLMCFSGACWAGISRIVFACKRTDDMIKNNYYLGTLSISETNKTNNRPLEITHLPNFKEEVLEIIQCWSDKNQ